MLASGNITLTLPVVTATDNGLTITIKHIGNHTDQVTVATSGGATNDGLASSILHRWLSRTFVAYNGNWIRKEKEAKTHNVLEVSSTGSWTSIKEAIEFLDNHMSGPAVIRLSGEEFPIDETQIINLPYPLTIEGVSYGATTVTPSSGIGNTPLFRCQTESYFKKIAFDGTALPGYGNNAGQDAIQLEGAGEYHEIKDCSFEHFNKTIVLENRADLWLFETDITDAVVSGVEIISGTNAGVQLTASECDFTNCAKGINLLSGVNAITNIVNCTFYNTAGQMGIVYVPATFTSFTAMFITNNAWNNIGTFISGFDFSRTDGRDANAFVQNNAGDGDKNPNCFINLLNNTATTVTISPANTWRKANWGTNTDYNACKWIVVNNRISYQPSNRKDGWFTISGNLSVDNSNRVISIGIVKNGSSTVRYGETTLRTSTANQPYQFSFVAYLENIAPGDYFEIYHTSANNNDVIKIQDIQWMVNTQ